MVKSAAAEDDRTSASGTKSAATRQRSLDAAAHVLSRQGYAGTRLGDVAEEAQLQAPAICYYFPSREDLIEEVMWAGIAHVADHAQQQLAALPADASPMDRIEVAVEAHLRYELEVSDFATASIRNAGQVPGKDSPPLLRRGNWYGDAWRKLFEDAKRAGLLRPELDTRAARMLSWAPSTGRVNGGTHGAAHWSKSSGR